MSTMECRLHHEQCIVEENNIQERLKIEHINSDDVAVTIILSVVRDRGKCDGTALLLSLSNSTASRSR